MTTFYDEAERDTEQTQAQTTEQFPGLNDQFQFFQVVDASGKPQAGQYFAIGQYEDPVDDGGTYRFDAFYPILRQPNSAIRLVSLTETQINAATPVTTKDPAATVNKTHPRLIRFLLIQ